MDDFFVNLFNSVVGALVYEALKVITTLAIPWGGKFKEGWSWPTGITVAIVIFTCFSFFQMQYTKSNTLKPTADELTGFLQKSKCTTKTIPVSSEATWVISAICNGRDIRFYDVKDQPALLRFSAGKFFTGNDLEFLRRLSSTEVEVFYLKLQMELAKLGMKFHIVRTNKEGDTLSNMELYIVSDQMSVNNRLNTDELSDKLSKLVNASDLITGMFQLQKIETNYTKKQ